MTAQLSREELEILAFNGETHTERELARMLLAGMESEPVVTDANGKVGGIGIGKCFRPIRSESDKKRDEVTKAIASALFKDGDFDTKESLRLATFVYGALSRNEIPHIRIE